MFQSPLMETTFERAYKDSIKIVNKGFGGFFR